MTHSQYTLDSIQYYKSFDKIRKKIINIMNLNNTNFEFKLLYNSLPQYVYIRNKDILLYEIPYQILGYYIPDIKIWCWGWGHILSRDVDIITSFKAFKYGLTLDYDVDNIKSKLINSRLEIEKEEELEPLIALMSNLSENAYIFNFPTETYGIIYVQFDKETLEKYNLN